ncbi:MAG TPA: hypothetical protein VL978_10135, partial [Puia sp.]|nr:hypothetical protein [Puia sp.]
DAGIPSESLAPVGQACRDARPQPPGINSAGFTVWQKDAGRRTGRSYFRRRVVEVTGFSPNVEVGRQGWDDGRQAKE